MRRKRKRKDIAGKKQDKIKINKYKEEKVEKLWCRLKRKESQNEECGSGDSGCLVLSPIVLKESERYIYIYIYI